MNKPTGLPVILIIVLGVLAVGCVVGSLLIAIGINIINLSPVGVLIQPNLVIEPPTPKLVLPAE